MGVFGKLIDRQAEWVAKWLHSRIAFIQLVYGTLIWVPLVIFGIDKHGFIYLYIATSLSLITQSPLAMLSFWAARDARKSQEQMQDLLKATLSMMEATHAVVQAVRADIEELEETREELERAQDEG